ncbi:hypothetical protein BGZ60DRAFT_215130 [Tricladium varicosporioides]|nr:hypothetical protein BGZ60DRAFT_215130 [Hymenoscyphus varicosporioides]
MSRLTVNGTIAILIFLIGVVMAVDNHGVNFTYPTEGLTLYRLDTVNVSWTSNFSKPLLYTFCKNKTGDNLITEKQTSAQPYNASELVLLNFDNVASCYFNLRPNTSTGFGANSPTFKYILTQRSQTTLGVSEPTGTTAPTSVPPNNNGGLSTGAKAGIGIGVALGVIAIFSMVAFFLWQRRRGGRGRSHFNPNSSINGSISGPGGMNDIQSAKWHSHSPYGKAPSTADTYGSGGGYGLKQISGMHEIFHPEVRHEMSGDSGGAPLQEMGGGEVHEMEGNLSARR